MTHECFDYCWAVLAQCQQYLLFQLPPPVYRIGVCKKQGGSKTRTANPKWPNRYSMPYNVIISSKTERKGILGKVAIVWRLTRDWCTCRRWQVPLHNLFFVWFFFFLPLSFTYKTISTHEFSCFCSTYPLPCPGWDREGKGTSICVVLSCLPWLTNSRELPLSGLGATTEFVI